MDESSQGEPPFTQTTSQATAPSQVSRLRWTEGMEIALIDALIIEVQTGKRAENGFKRESYIRMTAAVNLKSNRTVGAQQVKTKYHLVST